jgi:hypothetical protein
VQKIKGIAIKIKNEITKQYLKKNIILNIIDVNKKNK